MNHLFVDTNIFLNFYHYDDDDLDQLGDLVKLIEQKEIEMYLPRQVEDEFYRNRESRIRDAIRRLEREELKFVIPQLCIGFEGTEELRKHEQGFQEARVRLAEKLRSLGSSQSLKADRVVRRLFEKGTRLKVTDDLYRRAHRRQALRNPPGKSNSMGDAVNWEVLMEHVPEKADLFFVSGDSDYQSALSRDDFPDFLQTEWFGAKGSKVFFFRTLAQLLDARFPSVEIASERAKEDAVRALEGGGSFEQICNALLGLREAGELSREQILRVVRAGVSGNRTLWTRNDGPGQISKILGEMVAGREDIIPGDEFAVFCRKFGLDTGKRIRR